MESFRVNQRKNTRGKQKNHKHYRDLNNSLANLASKRITGRSISDTEGNQDITSPDLLKNKLGSKFQYENHNDSYSAPHGTKVPTVFQKNAFKKMDSPDIKSEKGFRSVSGYQGGRHKLLTLDLLSASTEKNNVRNRQSNESRYTIEHPIVLATKQKPAKNSNSIAFHQYNVSKDSNRNSITSGSVIKRESHRKNFGGDSAGLAEVNYPRHGARDLLKHFDEGSLSSIGSVRNPAESRISGITDEFRVEDLPNFPYHSRNNLSSVQNASKKSGTKPETSEQTSLQNPTFSNPNSYRGQHQSGLKINKTALITPTFKTDQGRPSYIIYDMHDIISRHTKERLDYRRATVEMEESKGRGEEGKSNVKMASFQAIEGMRRERFEFESRESSLERIDKNQVSDGVEYRAGGVGVESSSTRKGRRDSSKLDNLEISLKEEALKVFLALFELSCAKLLIN